MRRHRAGRAGLSPLVEISARSSVSGHGLPTMTRECRGMYSLREGLGVLKHASRGSFDISKGPSPLSILMETKVDRHTSCSIERC